MCGHAFSCSTTGVSAHARDPCALMELTDNCQSIRLVALSCHRLSLNEGPLTLVCRFGAAGPLSTPICGCSVGHKERQLSGTDRSAYDNRHRADWFEKLGTDLRELSLCQTTKTGESNQSLHRFNGRRKPSQTPLREVFNTIGRKAAVSAARGSVPSHSPNLVWHLRVYRWATAHRLPLSELGARRERSDAANRHSPVTPGRPRRS